MRPATVGVFDSGVGGLSVWIEIARQLCAGLAAARMLEPGRKTGPPVLVALLLGLLSGLYASFALAAPAVRVAVGAESRSDYLARTWPVYEMFEAINRSAPEEARILVLGDEPRFFYLERDYLFGNHAEIFSREDLATPAAFLRALRGMGVTHIVLPRAALGREPASSGTIEMQAARLAAAGTLPLVLIDERWPLGLWAVADERNEEPK